MHPKHATFARTAHEGQTDKSGQDLFDHVREVAEFVEQAGGDDELTAAAWLHDVVEDTDTNLFLLDAIGASPRQLDIIQALTRTPDEDYQRYLDRIVACGADAIAVKQADLKSNTDPERMGKLDPADRDRLSQRYAKAIRFLNQTQE